MVEPAAGIESPPRTLGGVLRRLGPGLIIAASIVGSGELIATTKTGADAGYTLLWLILIGCVIKVFVQVEFGRFTIAEGRGTMDAMNAVPGPRWRVNWLLWYWVLMFLGQIGQLGGIVGGVGQSMAMTAPITGDFLQSLDEQDRYEAQAAQVRFALQLGTDLNQAEATAWTKRLLGAPPQRYTYDDVYWAALITVATSIMLVNGRYGVVQAVATVLVVGFTLVTVFNLVALPFVSQHDIGWGHVLEGLRFHLPEPRPGSTKTPLATALATFGIIGVGASELVAYPYWCLEKGYARFAGPRDDSPGWADRANGWLRVMRCDAWCSMVVYTFATIAFYVLGAAVLHPRGLSPEGNSMIRTLATIYDTVFDPYGWYVFLVGAFAVLYSTFFVAIAGNARIAADGVRAFGFCGDDEAHRQRLVRIFCAVLPFLSLGIFMWHKDPVTLVLLSGVLQALNLPMLGAAALYFRYRRCDARIAPGRLWDTLLWLSVAGLSVPAITLARQAVQWLLQR